MLVSHGPLAEGVLKSAEMILGPQQNVTTLSVTMDTTLDGMTHEIENCYRNNGESDTLIICDILGGTPSNASMRFIAGKSNVRILTGLNLPMVLELFMATGKSLDELFTIGIEAYRKGLHHFEATDLDKPTSEENLEL
jgi:PTS system mannose-specific IIA component